MKRIFIVLMIGLNTVATFAQDMKSIFVHMPDSILPLLTKVNREDCIDFLASNMKAVVTNRLDKQTELKVLTDSYLQMQVTDASMMELKLLPLNDSVKIICEVRTMCAPVCDSNIRFYDTDWNALDTSDYFNCPSDELFYQTSDSLGSVPPETRSKADMYMVRLALHPDEETLSVEYTTPDYLNEMDRKTLLPFLRKEPVVYKWRDGTFQNKRLHQ